MAVNTFPSLSLNSNARDNIRVTNNILRGKLNALIEVTLTANQNTTAVSSELINPSSLLLFMPTTANAAVEVASGTMYVSSVTTKAATITHANNAQTDRSFKVLVIG